MSIPMSTCRILRLGLGGGPIHMNVQLSPFERGCRRDMRGAIGAEHFFIQSPQKHDEPAVGWCGKHHYASALGRRKAPIVEVVAIECNERTAKLLREPVVFAVPRATKVVVLEHEQHIPPELLSHMENEARRNIGIHIDARLSRQASGVCTQLRRYG